MSGVLSHGCGGDELPLLRRYEHMCNKYAAGNLNGIRAAAKNAAFQDPQISVPTTH